MKKSCWNCKNKECEFIGDFLNKIKSPKQYNEQDFIDEAETCINYKINELFIEKAKVFSESADQYNRGKTKIMK